MDQEQKMGSVGPEMGGNLREIPEDEWRQVWESTDGSKPGAHLSKQPRRVLLGNTWHEFFAGGMTKEGFSIQIKVPDGEGGEKIESVKSDDPRIRMITTDYGEYTYENLAQDPDRKPERFL